MKLTARYASHEMHNKLQLQITAMRETVNDLPILYLFISLSITANFFTTGRSVALRSKSAVTSCVSETYRATLLKRQINRHASVEAMQFAHNWKFQRLFFLYPEYALIG